MLLLGWVGLAMAGDLVVEGMSETRSYTCAAGQRVVVNGSMLRVTLDGDCGFVEVNGASNKITVDGTAGLRLVGTSNTVTWSRNLSGQSKLPVTRTGSGNKVSQR